MPILAPGVYTIRSAENEKLVMTPDKTKGGFLNRVITGLSQPFKWNVIFDRGRYAIEEHDHPDQFAHVERVPWQDSSSLPKDQNLSEGVYVDKNEAYYEIVSVPNDPNDPNAARLNRYWIRVPNTESVFKSNGPNNQVTLTPLVPSIQDLNAQWDFEGPYDTPKGPPRVRRDIRELEYDYSLGKKKELETLILAFRGIISLPPNDPNSFFVIAGYHGMPFRGAGWGNPAWWGGYCNHGNVLFPVWHRAYCLRLEDALRSIKGCSDVTLPYWNEIDDSTVKSGLPSIFLSKTFTIGDETFPNPLYSYKFVAGIYDNLSPIPDADYSKPQGYQTVRYPFSGLVGPKDKKATDAHNATMTELGDAITDGYLNKNIENWLDFSITNNKGEVIYTGTRGKYQKCLDAPNYTVFSNTTSATQYNEDNFGVESYVEKGAPGAAPEAVVPLESPHNDMHLAIGGFDLPGMFNVNAIAGANGDMGENDTAAFDPIFFFHHCFVDKVFWTWQQKWGKINQLDVIAGYPGTNSVDNQGPTPGVAGGTWLNMNSPLDPFKRPNGQPLTGNDLANIEQLGYTYSLLQLHLPTGVPNKSPTPTLRIAGINRAKIPGSFVISTWAGDKLIHSESVLSRWHVQGCSNCGTHLNVKTFVPLHGWSAEEVSKADFKALVHTRKDREGISELPGGLKIKPELGHIGFK